MITSNYFHFPESSSDIPASERSLISAIWHHIQNETSFKKELSQHHWLLKNKDISCEQFNFSDELKTFLLKKTNNKTKIIYIDKQAEELNFVCSLGCQISLHINHTKTHLQKFEAGIFHLQHLSHIEIEGDEEEGVMILKLPKDFFGEYCNQKLEMQHWLTSPSTKNTLLDQQAEPTRKHIVLAKTCEMLSLLLHMATQTQQEHNQSDSLSITRRAQSILHMRYASPPSLDQLARRLGTNRNKLSRSFKEVHGLTVFEYCQQYRMEVAKRMLSDDRYNIAHVAEHVGYDHPGNFTSAYKRHFGELPKSTKRRPKVIKRSYR